jgi:hypothetical protein
MNRMELDTHGEIQQTTAIGGAEHRSGRERVRERRIRNKTEHVMHFHLKRSVGRMALRGQVISRVELSQPARPTSVERGWSSIRAVVTTDDKQQLQYQVNPWARVSVPYREANILSRATPSNFRSWYVVT